MTFFSIAALLVTTALLFALSGLAVRIQMTLLGNFDFSIAAVALVGSEIFASRALYPSLGEYQYLIAASSASVLVSALTLTGWNFLYLKYSIVLPNAKSSLFIVSLGFSMFASGLVGVLRGPGLRQSGVLASRNVVFQGVVIGIPTLYMLLAGSAALFAFLWWVKGRTGFALSLLAQNSAFAQELGVEAKKLSLICGVAGGAMAGLVGSYLSFSSGSTPQIGLPVFLYGAGAALVLSAPTWRACIFGGALLGGLHVLIQLFYSPAWANTIIFLIVAFVISLRGTSRTSQRVR